MFDLKYIGFSNLLIYYSVKTEKKQTVKTNIKATMCLNPVIKVLR